MKKKSAVRKNLLRTIKGSLTRYIAILGIIALGSAMFVGLVSTKADMVETGSRFMQQQNMFDLRLISTYGWTQEDVDAVSQMAGVSMAEGHISMDLIASLGDEDSSVYKLHSIPEDINQVKLLGGRMPENPNECLIDGQYVTDEVLGKTFTVSQDNSADALDSLHQHTYTVVGYVGTPLYMDISRGSTNVGNGIVSGFVYLPQSSFRMDVYTELTLCFTEQERPYTDGYDALLKRMTDALQPQVQALADARRDKLVADAEGAYQQGLAQYEKVKILAQQGIPEAQAQLAELEKQLAMARQAIDSMAPAEVFILDRNLNAGYLAVNNNSDIVAGVSRVFPAFFLLIAAMVCITTMTRMVVEERTQIGTLKALGYGNRTIISKYLLYAGSAAIIGCGIGTMLGSVIFPSILWEVYKIIIFVPEDVVLLIDWPLCLAVVASYTVVVLLVTWYCCRRTLRQVPAELIRPKAPTSGKKIWLEHFRLWHRFSFLNKVMLRNVFRYRQRMFMMLLGIGGCTALLLTGFGLRDSVKNLVPEQFGKVTVYDMQIHFAEGQSLQAQEAFTRELSEQGMSVHFYYQSGIELHHGDQARELNILLSDSGVRDYIHFTWDGEDLGMPGKNEAFLSVGMAEQMGISVGDRITLRNSQMQTLELTVAGIYHNSVYNYVIVAPETVLSQWEELPLPQMALVKVPEGLDPSQAGAEIGTMEGVINVTVTRDLIEQLDGMLAALDMIVIVVVICAGALAAIVLYNLTNINITERLREIATIKVLGFRAWETAAYVYKENMLLSAMGMICGIPFGYWLLKFVVSQIKVDLVWLTPSLSVSSCLISAVLTMLSALVVNGILYRKLERINMAEALKSVE